MLSDDGRIVAFRIEWIDRLFGFFEREEGFVEALHFAIIRGNPENGGCLSHELEGEECLDAEGNIANPDRVREGIWFMIFMDHGYG